MLKGQAQDAAWLLILSHASEPCKDDAAAFSQDRDLGTQANGSLLPFLEGFYAFLLTCVALGAALCWGVELHYVYHHFLPLALAAATFAMALSIYLAVRAAWAPPAALAPASSGEQCSPAISSPAGWRTHRKEKTQ